MVFVHLDYPPPSQRFPGCYLIASNFAFLLVEHSWSLLVATVRWPSVAQLRRCYRRCWCSWIKKRRCVQARRRVGQLGMARDSPYVKGRAELLPQWQKTLSYWGEAGEIGRQRVPLPQSKWPVDWKRPHLEGTWWRSELGDLTPPPFLRGHSWLHTRVYQLEIGCGDISSPSDLRKGEALRDLRRCVCRVPEPPSKITSPAERRDRHHPSQWAEGESEATLLVKGKYSTQL